MPKRTAQRYRVEGAPTKGSTWVRVGRSCYAHRIVWAKFTPLEESGRRRDFNRPIVQMLVALNDAGRRQVYVVHISGDEPFTSTSIRLPLDAMARAAIASCSYRLEADTAHPMATASDVFLVDHAAVNVDHLELDRLRELERHAKMRAQRSSVTDDELRRVANIVRETPYRQRRAAVQEELKVSYAVAKSRIAAARRRGDLAEGGSEARS